MKLRSLYISLMAVAFLAVVTLNSCDGDDDPSAAEKKLNLLAAHDWSLKAVTVNSVDKTSMFTGLTLLFKRDNTFTTTEGGVIWPAVGTWSFTDGTAEQLSVSLSGNGDAEVAIVTLNETSLIISLHWDETTIGQGRNKSIEGDHVFEFEAID